MELDDIEKIADKTIKEAQKQFGQRIEQERQKSERIAEVAKRLHQLRDERGISQKKAAADLGVSQALLSHYEKGIRECSVSFIIKCCDYYGITTDYLLGVSSDRHGFSFEAINTKIASKDADDLTKLTQAARILIAVLSNCNDDKVKEYAKDYYNLCVYRGAITLAKAGLLPKEYFKIDYNIGRELASAAMSIEDAKFAFLEDKSRTSSKNLSKNELTEIIEKAEQQILGSFVFE